MLCSLTELALDERDFPYGVIKAAAILGDYHVLKGEKPSLPEELTPGLKIFGKVVAGQVDSIETTAYKTYQCAVNVGDSVLDVTTDCQNIHTGDFVALDLSTNRILTPNDLHAQPKEFPHCIDDGIFILNEDCKSGDDIPTLLGLDDHVVEFEITPNRPDCLSVIGLAREAAVTFGKL